MKEYSQSLTRHVRRYDFLISVLLGSLITFFCYLYVFFRLGFGDEGYWILVAKHSNDLVANLSGLVSHPLWILSFENLKMFRLVGFIFSIVSGAIFSHGLILMTRTSDQVKSDCLPFIIKTLIYLLPGTIFLVAMESSTPHYNTYVFWSMSSLAGLIMISNSCNVEGKVRRLWFAAGALSVIGALGKIFVLFFALIIVFVNPRRKIISFLLGACFCLTLLVWISGRSTNLVKDLFEQYRYYSIVSSGYSISELLNATLFSIKYSIGGYVYKIIYSFPLIVFSISVILVCLLIGLKAFEILMVWVTTLLISATLVWPEESRNGSTLFVIALLILIILRMIREKRSLIAGSPAVVIASLLVIPAAFAFGSTAGGFMPKWGYCSGIYLASMLTLASRVYRGEKIKQSFFVLTSIIILGSQVMYTLLDSQHSGGSLLNRFRFVNAGELGAFYVDHDQYSTFRQINSSMSALRQGYQLKDAILLDLSEFQPLIGMSLGLKTPVIGLTLNSIGGIENEEQDIQWFDYVNTVEEQVTFLDKPFILINRAFTKCDWVNKCQGNLSLTMRETALAKYVIDYPQMYEYVSTIGENFLLANKLRKKLE